MKSELPTCCRFVRCLWQQLIMRRPPCSCCLFAPPLCFSLLLTPLLRWPRSPATPAPPTAAQVSGDGRFLYCCNELDNTVSSFSLGELTGGMQMTLLQVRPRSYTCCHKVPTCHSAPALRRGPCVRLEKYALTDSVGVLAGSRFRLSRRRGQPRTKTTGQGQRTRVRATHLSCGCPRMAGLYHSSAALSFRRQGRRWRRRGPDGA